jgi:type 1 glutamine amidotransferase
VIACVFWIAGTSAVQVAEAAKLKALWTSGGRAHDYATRAPLLTEKISQYANVSFKVVNEPNAKVFRDPGYAKGYDVVVYDICYGSEKDKDLIDNIIRTIREGKPTVIVHATLHTFRDADRDDWREAMGLTSKSHDTLRGLTTKKVAPHPITKFWPEDWKTPGEELYRNLKFWPSATALLTAYSVESKKDQVVCWVNQCGKGKVFATTLGHDMRTIGQDEYQHLLANGLLWACGRLDDQGEPAPGYEGTARK